MWPATKRLHGIKKEKSALVCEERPFYSTFLPSLPKVVSLPKRYKAMFGGWLGEMRKLRAVSRIATHLESLV